MGGGAKACSVVVNTVEGLTTIGDKKNPLVFGHLEVICTFEKNNVIKLLHLQTRFVRFEE